MDRLRRGARVPLERGHRRNRLRYAPRRAAERCVSNGAQEKGLSTGEPMPARYRAMTLAFALGMSAAVLLGQGTQTLPDAIKADSKTYSVEFENDVVRVLRVRLAPGVRRRATPMRRIARSRFWIRRCESRTVRCRRARPARSSVATPPRTRRQTSARPWPRASSWSSGAVRGRADGSDGLPERRYRPVPPGR